MREFAFRTSVLTEKELFGEIPVILSNFKQKSIHSCSHNSMAFLLLIELILFLLNVRNLSKLDIFLWSTIPSLQHRTHNHRPYRFTIFLLMRRFSEGKAKALGKGKHSYSININREINKRGGLENNVLRSNFTRTFCINFLLTVSKQKESK